MIQGARIPVATYRLQFNGNFRFADATAIISYLHDLGITDLYSSPVFKARKGSIHGYDIIDPNSLNPEMGTNSDFDAMVEELRKYGMGQILDIVPNHMCIESSENAWWCDVLENGPSAIHASFFDIDWHPIKKELRNRILLPILGDQYGTILDNGELALHFNGGAFFVTYYDYLLPIAPQSYSTILTYRLDRLQEVLPQEDEALQELMSIDTALKNLPPSTETEPEKISLLYREKEIAKRRLMALYNKSSEIRNFIDENIGMINGSRDDPASFDLLDKLLGQQVYRLAHWRVATEEINYRRFFDINGLAAIRMELPNVFAESHRLIFRLLREGKATGLRVDHLDGLYDPAEYLQRLQRGCFLQRGLSFLEQKAEEPFGEKETAEKEAGLQQIYDELLTLEPKFKAFYIVGEKILLKGEKLPDEWPVFGTTGYDFGNTLNGLFVDMTNGRWFDAIYARFTHAGMSFSDVVYEKKKLVMQSAMSGEINTLGYYLNVISEENRNTRDFTLNSLIKAVVEVVAFFPVYRTYTSGPDVSDRDRHYIEYAVAKAKRRNPATDPSVFDFVARVLLLETPAMMEEPGKEAWLDFVMRLQQVTSPVTAKGLEDTTFYVYNRLLSLNEVGGSPDRFGITLDAFHGQNIERAKTRPSSLLATSTHDTKRSEDVRARINVLSEIAEKWRGALVRWSRLNAKMKLLVDGQSVPDRNEEYLLYQTLLGAWPIEPFSDADFETFRRRIKEYMLKAVREAKVNSSWIRPNSSYEEAVASFIDSLLAADSAFLGNIKEFQQLTSHCGMLNSLSQTLLKITSPGIPDFYQGTEIWDLTLVDPDNRRPVDFELRQRLLEEIRNMEMSREFRDTARELLERMRDGRVKLYLIRRALGLRKRRKQVFEEGKYLTVEVLGEKADNVCAFERRLGDDSIIVVAPRFFSKLIRQPDGLPIGEEVWQDMEISAGADGDGRRYRDIFTGLIHEPVIRETGKVFRLSELLSDFPVALLEQVDAEN